MTLMMRPSVPSPTGTMIGAPVSVTSWPRARPSDMSIAMQRTEDLAEMLRDFEHEAVAAVGRLERVQDLGQMAVELHVDDGADHLRDTPVAACLPGYVSGHRSVRYWISSERFGARDDFDQFLGDHRLTRAVVDHRLLLDHLAGIAGRVVHGAHLRAVNEAMFSSSARKTWTEMLRGSSAARISLLVRLVLVGHAVAPRRACARRDSRRDQLQRRRDLRDHRLEAREEQGADVELAGLVACAMILLARSVRRCRSRAADGAQIDDAR